MDLRGLLELAVNQTSKFATNASVGYGQRATVQVCFNELPVV